MCVVKDYFSQHAGIQTPPINLYAASSKSFSTTKGQITLSLHPFYITNQLDLKYLFIFRNKIPPPLVSYSYTNNISRSVFNYNQTLRNFNLDDYRNASSSCDCESSTFRYQPHGHVITGDQRIVRNRRLSRLLEKGPKYGEENIIDWKLNKKILITAIDDYQAPRRGWGWGGLSPPTFLAD